MVERSVRYLNHKKIILKTYCFAFLILTNIYLASSATAQHIQIGPVVGLNRACMNIDFSDEKKDRDIGTKTGFTFGGVLYLALSSNIGLQFEPAYIQKGSKVEQRWIGNGKENKTEQTIKANFIDIPLLFRASFGQRKIKPYIVAGANIALKIGEAKLELDNFTVDGVEITNLISSDDREVELKIKGTDFCLNFGIGVLFPVMSRHFFIEGQYNIGLRNIYDDDDPGVTGIKTKGIQIKTGIFLSLSG